MDFPDSPIDSSIKIINNSNQDILMLDYNQFQFPDTLFVIPNPFSDTSSIEYKRYFIEKKSFKEYPGSYKAGFNRSSTKLMIFLFSKDTIDQVPWEKIRSEYKILKRYDLGLRELDSLNWTIEYN